MPLSAIDRIIPQSRLTSCQDTHVATTGLHRDSIAAIFKTAGSRAGMNATDIAGHSVRAGMATQAALNGSSERAIAKTTCHWPTGQGFSFAHDCEKPISKRGSRQIPTVSFIA